MGCFGFPFRLPSLIERERELQDRIKITVREKERHRRKCASYFSSSINNLISGNSHMGWNPAEIHHLMSSSKSIKPVLYFSHKRVRCTKGLTRLGAHSLSLKKWYNK